MYKSRIIFAELGYKSQAMCVCVCVNVFMSRVHEIYSNIISLENLFDAWYEFKKDKRGRKDVQVFERYLEDNLFSLHEELREKTYKHGDYTAFNIYDPKFRHIHKAQVIDRIVHHAIVSVIDPIFDKTFIYDSYSCRKNRGTHKAVKRLSGFIRKVSKNYKEDCFCLKLDIEKFFESVDHSTLTSLIAKKIQDKDLLLLIKNILKSFSKEKGIPIGNLTSQLFANVYLDDLDQFVKHELKIKYYIRYADDFIILSTNQEYLKQLIPRIAAFLKTNLALSLHENKIVIRKHTQGIDFLGYIVLPRYILPRTKTKRRMFKKMKGKVSSENFNQSLQSYLGYLKHANSYKLSQQIKNEFFWGLDKN